MISGFYFPYDMDRKSPPIAMQLILIQLCISEYPELNRFVSVSKKRFE
jgi:hypothetical protein